MVVLSSILEQILNELRDMPDVAPFMFPVNAKQVADYHKIIQRPMDLQTIREYIRQKKYQTRDEFLADINQIVENSSLYNGVKSSLTIAAQRMLQKCKDRMQEKEERLNRLEKSINPLLDDDDQVALSYILGEYVNGPLKAMPESWPFLKPVNKRLVKDYYTIIRRPMDLEKVSKKVATHKYHSRADFLQDIQLIADNCETYNGAEANFTKQAKTMVEAVKRALDAMDNVSQLEKNIALVQERARNEAEIEWEDDERDSKYFQGSRDTSPDHEFGEGEASNLERPSSSASMASVRPGLGGGLSKTNPDGKKVRGRPRKLQHEEDGGQYSTDDEEFEEVTMSDNEGVSVTLDQSNLPSNASALPPPEEGDSQQAAEAMVALSGTQQFAAQNAEESMEIDPNYDPSDFLGMSNRQLGGPEEGVQIQPDQIDSGQFQFQTAGSAFEPTFQQFPQPPLQFADSQPQQILLGADGQQQQLLLQQQQSGQSLVESQSQQGVVLPPLQSLHKDLAISDSDDEQNLQMDIFNNANENDDNDDGGDLWF